MLIWLGKQMLGQKDKQDITSAINSDIKVIVELGREADPAPWATDRGRARPHRPDRVLGTQLSCADQRRGSTEPWCP